MTICPHCEVPPRETAQGISVRHGLRRRGLKVPCSLTHRLPVYLALEAFLTLSGAPKWLVVILAPRPLLLASCMCLWASWYSWSSEWAGRPATWLVGGQAGYGAVGEGVCMHGQWGQGDLAQWSLLSQRGHFTSCRTREEHPVPASFVPH